MDQNSKLRDLLDKLPPFIQKGNKLCKLNIWKENSLYMMKYTNATDDLLDHDSDLTALTSRILQQIRDIEGTKGYIIKWDFQ